MRPPFTMGGKGHRRPKRDFGLSNCGARAHVCCLRLCFLCCSACPVKKHTGGGGGEVLDNRNNVVCIIIGQCLLLYRQPSLACVAPIATSRVDICGVCQTRNGHLSYADHWTHKPELRERTCPRPLVSGDTVHHDVRRRRWIAANRQGWCLCSVHHPCKRGTSLSADLFVSPITHVVDELCDVHRETKDVRHGRKAWCYATQLGTNK